MKLGLACIFLIAVGCGPAAMQGDDTQTTDMGDSDGDGISDVDEGRAAATDTDGDGTPDYLDDDSDGDGIPDYREAGDSDLGSKPFDSDGDGTPDFQDTDSDNNGRLDNVDGVEDPDNDGQGNYADLDDDGDAIDDVTELGPDPAQPIDSDGDGIPDFRDTDSDNDTILDLAESANDFDADGIPNYLDLDSDGDCIPDMVEARGNPAADSDMDGRPDFLDRDSDNDGVPDQTEDANCNGSADAGESSATNGDTDGDGVSDLIETTAGTDPTNPASNPQANGDFVFVEPYQQPQSPTDEDLNFSTSLKAVDLYVLLDRSGSMSAEIASVKNNLATVVANLTCPPGNTGSTTCIPDLWAGAATIGYQGAGAAAFQNWVDVQPNASFAGVPITEPGNPSNFDEPLTFATLAAATGTGGANYSMPSVPARGSCANSPAGATAFGYGCFRSNALSVVLLATDEPPISAGGTYKNPLWSAVLPQYLSRKIRLVGILGDGAAASVGTDLRQMATDTGAVDAANGNAPLVFNGFGANAATAIQNGIRALAAGLPLDINAITTDDPSDAIDAVASFIDHIETLQLGTTACANGLNDIDTNGDTFHDKFLQVRTGTPVCWKVVSKQNTVVPATDEPQLYRATVSVFGDGVTQLDTRNVFFLVPPKPLDGPIGKTAPRMAGQ